MSDPREPSFSHSMMSGYYSFIKGAVKGGVIGFIGGAVIGGIIGVLGGPGGMAAGAIAAGTVGATILGSIGGITKLLETTPSHNYRRTQWEIGNALMENKPIEFHAFEQAYENEKRWQQQLDRERQTQRQR